MTTCTSGHFGEVVTGSLFDSTPQKSSLEGTGHMKVATCNYNQASGTKLTNSGRFGHRKINSRNG